MTLKRLLIVLVMALGAALLGFYVMTDQETGETVNDSNANINVDIPPSSKVPSRNVPADPSLPRSLAKPIIIIRKAARRLELYDGPKLIKIYKAALGFAPVGDKEVEGDGRTPEGEFYVFVKNEGSQFTVSLGLSYPNNEDAERGVAAGLITQDEANEIKLAIERKGMPPQKTRLGGEIYIHGSGSGTDWTWGCIALDDKDILELFGVAKQGMPVTILP